MTAYVLVEATVRNVEARDRYLEAVRPVLKQFGGSFWHLGRGACSMASPSTITA